MTESLEAFVGLASTSRFPDAQERYFNRSDWVGDPSLPPVRNNETNIGFTFRRNRLYGKVLGFYTDIDNFVYVREANPMIAPNMRTPSMTNMSTVRLYANADARMYGMEFSYGAALGARWMLSGGASFTRGSKDAQPTIGAYSTTLSELPPLRGRTSLRYGRRLWFAEIEGIVANTQRRVNPELLETPTAGYAILNAKVGWHAGRATVTVGLDNALDRFYYESLSYQRDPFRNGVRIPEPGRSLFVSLSYRFEAP
jgi:iron complex outermembrane receptor protein